MTRRGLDDRRRVRDDPAEALGGRQGRERAGGGIARHHVADGPERRAHLVGVEAGGERRQALLVDVRAGAAGSPVGGRRRRRRRSSARRARPTGRGAGRVYWNSVGLGTGAASSASSTKARGARRRSVRKPARSRRRPSGSSPSHSSGTSATALSSAACAVADRRSSASCSDPAAPSSTWSAIEGKGSWAVLASGREPCWRKSAAP